MRGGASIPPLCHGVSRLHSIAVKALISGASGTAVEAVADIAKGVVAQLEHDLGSEVATVVRQRILEDMTLQQIAEDKGISRERIRQRVEQAGEAIRIRWPEGAGLLFSLAVAATLVQRSSAQEILLRVLEQLYAIPKDAFARLSATRLSRPREVEDVHYPAPASLDGEINDLIVGLLSDPDR